jgi:hypothetical protein
MLSFLTGFFGSKLTKYVIILAILGGAGTFIWFQYKGAINAAYRAGVNYVIQEQLEYETQNLKEQIEDNKKEMQQLSSSLRKEQLRTKDLERMLGLDHDLDKLLQAKPGMILKRVNDGTAEVLQEFEEVANE